MKKNINKEVCENCGSDGNTNPLKTCSRCKLVYYCSKECQTIHWKKGHRKTCISINDRQVNQQIQVTESAEQEKGIIVCAICLSPVQTNDYNAPCTLPCEHTFHTNCITSLRTHEGLSQVCPLCRTDLPPGPEQAFLEARSICDQYNNQLNSVTTLKDKDQVKKAIELFKCSAEEGYMSSQHNLGFLYHQGEGVKQDYATAEKWYLKAIDQNYEGSMTNLGAMYAGARKGY